MGRDQGDSTAWFRIRRAGSADLPRIHALRHEVYAGELRQHASRPDGRLPDALDSTNIYLLAEPLADGGLVGFVGVTPPGAPLYSFDRHFPRGLLPVPVDDRLAEVRALTVAAPARGRGVGHALMFAALQTATDCGAASIIAMGRADLMELYEAVGLERTGRQAVAGSVTYELMHAGVPELQRLAAEYLAQAKHPFPDLCDSLGQPLPAPAVEPPPQRDAAAPPAPVPGRPDCPAPHGGRVYSVVGTGFQRMEARPSVIPADVLDAWFPPAPGVLRRVQEHLSWALQSSPPAGAEGVAEAVARHRGVPAECILPAGGSSQLIHLALRELLRPGARVLLPDPTYSEYAHVLGSLAKCRLDRLRLEERNAFCIDATDLAQRLATGSYDWLVLVNPNNPTGQHMPRSALERLLAVCPTSTRVWVDETYIDYVGQGESIERFAAASPNVVVCKSLSKAYALSGARAAYLCGPPSLLSGLRAALPPWSMGTLAQVATLAALEESAYYEARWAETASLRQVLADGLRALGLAVHGTCGNFVLCALGPTDPPAHEVRSRAEAAGLLVRDAEGMGRVLGPRHLRLAVRSQAENAKALAVLADILGRRNPSRRPTEALAAPMDQADRRATTLTPGALAAGPRARPR